MQREAPRGRSPQSPCSSLSSSFAAGISAPKSVQAPPGNLQLPRAGSIKRSSEGPSLSPLSKWSEGDWCEALTGLGTSSPGGRGGSGPVHLRPDTGLDFVWQRLSGPRWVRFRERSCCRHRILCFFAAKASNQSFCTCPRPETTNIQPDLQNGRQTLHAFVSQTPGGPSGAIIRSEWGLDLSSPPPLCSLSLGPLSRRKRLERGSFACFASGSGWATRSGRGEKGRRSEDPGLASRKCLGRAVCIPAAGPERTAREDVGVDPRGPVCIHRVDENSLLWKSGPLAFAAIPAPSLHGFLLITNSGPLLRSRTSFRCPRGVGAWGLGERWGEWKRSRFSGSVVVFKEP